MISYSSIKVHRKTKNMENCFKFGSITFNVHSTVGFHSQITISITGMMDIGLMNESNQIRKFQNNDWPDAGSSFCFEVF